MRLAVGLVIGLAGAAAMTYIAFGLNLPNLGQQDRLVIPEGIPNLTGLALGFGGETAQMRNVLTVLLVAVVVGCCIWAWQSRRWLTQCGWVELRADRDAQLDAPVVHRLAPAVRRARRARAGCGSRRCCSASTPTWRGCPTPREVLGFLT